MYIKDIMLVRSLNLEIKNFWPSWRWVWRGVNHGAWLLVRVPSFLGLILNAVSHLLLSGQSIRWIETEKSFEEINLAERYRAEMLTHGGIF